MKRWDLVGEYDPVMAEMCDGDYVLYSDAVKEISELRGLLRNNLLDIPKLEKIIEILETHTEHEDHGYCDTGEDMEYKCRSECVNMAIMRLKDAAMRGEI